MAANFLFDGLDDRFCFDIFSVGQYIENQRDILTTGLFMVVEAAVARNSSLLPFTGVGRTIAWLLLILAYWSTHGNAVEPLVMGVFPRRDAAITAKLFRPLSRHLELTLGMPVSLEMSPDFDTFLSNLKQRRYDLVHLNPFDYISAHENLAYDALVQNEEFGEATIKGAIYVRKDSGIRQLTELKGKKILFGGGPRAMMSYIVPTYLLLQAGLTKQDYEEAYAVNPPNAVLATSLRRADAGGAGRLSAVGRDSHTCRVQAEAHEIDATVPGEVRGDQRGERHVRAATHLDLTQCVKRNSDLFSVS